MAPDLADAIADTAEARATLTAPVSLDADVIATLSRRVRRRRMARAAARTLVAVPVAVVLGAGLWWGVREFVAMPVPATQPPAPTVPAPTESTAAPDPSASPDPTPTAFATAPAAWPTLPLPEDRLERTGPGWSLVTVRPAGHDTALDRYVTAGHALHLVAPAGERYFVAELPADRLYQFIFWRAGETRARVWETRDYYDPATDGLDSRVGWLDLVTGDFEAGGDGIGDQFLGHGADGREYWAGLDHEGIGLGALGADGAAQTVAELPPSRGVQLDPSGQRVASDGVDPARGYSLVDLASGAVSQRAFDLGDRDCAAVGWFDEASLLVSCEPVEDDRGGAYDEIRRATYRVLVDGGVAQQLTVDDLADGAYIGSAWTAVALGDGQVAHLGAGVDGGSHCLDSYATYVGSYPGGVHQPFELEMSSWSPSGAQGADAALSLRGHGGWLYVERSGCQARQAPVVRASNLRGPTADVLVVPPVSPTATNEWEASHVSWTGADG